eukprot:TRINITY_DN5767_c0_g1_i1.p1 TRINITY_DN5767_c0_g1~~TRINITY_DN5767_c0_g1_i1.p1  ORF type:complete len:585 (-),score=95.47 TRINITY_DN5767_c0_g1_i1:607-2361(-)
MDPTAPKSLERVVSQRALQMSSSFPCQVCVVGFLCGVCVTYFFQAALTSSRIVEFGFIYSNPSMAIPPSLNSMGINMSGSSDCSFIPNKLGKRVDLQISDKLDDDDKVTLLYSAWTAMLDESKNGEAEVVNVSSIPNAPHLENCALITQVNQRLDSRSENGSFPPWTIWKGLLGEQLLQPTLVTDGELMNSWNQENSGKAYPPWIVGADEDNIPLTRKVQLDLWIHQHPPNCSDPQVRFLVADWERLPGFGMGGQFAGMCGLLAIAVNEKRVLVTNYYNRADHDGCQGGSRSRWSCYFFPETSAECRDRALELMTRPEAWEQGIVKGKENYTSKEIWTGRIPRVWGNPWDYMQPTTEIDGILVTRHRKMDRRWWRAQAIRYLMRFQSKYTCGLLNTARHKAFGMKAARMVLGSLNAEWPENVVNKSQADIERFVWSNKKAWMPRPLLSLHVRMGDKAVEMKVVGFEEYMRLADRMRKRFPELNSIWLSTEMQEVIDKTRSYPHWNFYYTNVTRQFGNMLMANYEASLGRKTSTNYPLVNFLMATEADFFIGALGSTWCFLIDGMRNTGGKVMAGYLSVNKDRFW